MTLGPVKVMGAGVVLKQCVEEVMTVMLLYVACLNYYIYNYV